MKTLLASAWVVVGDWRADFVELLECSRRLVSRCEVPKFASEHAEALGLELRSMRAARRQAEAEKVEAERPAIRCPDCGGGGAVAVPNVHCVRDGRACLHPRLGYFATVVVWCRCEAGAWHAGRSKPYPDGPMTLDTYERGHVRREWWKQAMGDHAARLGGNPNRQLNPKSPFDAVLIQLRERKGAPQNPKPRFLLPQQSNRHGEA